MSAEDRAMRNIAWKTICEFFGLPDSDVTTIISAPDGTAQTATHVYGGSGAPSNSSGANGDYYVRSDGTAAPTATKDHVYFKSGGTWGGIA